METVIQNSLNTQNTQIGDIDDRDEHLSTFDVQKNEDGIHIINIEQYQTPEVDRHKQPNEDDFALDETIDLSNAKTLSVAESLRINFGGLAFVFLLAIRRCFSIGMLMIIIDKTPYLYHSGLGFLSIVLALLLVFPFFGTVLSFLPSLVLGCGLIYAYLGICSAYPGHGAWNILSAGIIFVTGLAGSWPTWVTTPIFSFFFAPLSVVLYANGNQTLQGNEFFSNPINQLANPVAITLLLGWLLSFLSCFLIPLPAAYVLSKELKYSTKLIANLYENIGNICSTGTTLDLLLSSRCLIKEAKVSLETAASLRDYAQIELFFTAINRFGGKYKFLSESLKIIEEMFRIGTDKFGVTGLLEPENLEILEKQVAFIQSLGDKKQLQKIIQELNEIEIKRPKAPKVGKGFTEPEGLVNCLQAIQNRIKTYEDQDFFQKGTYIGVWKGWLVHIIRGLLPVHDLYPNISLYLRSLEFGMRIMNCIIASSALVFSSMFVLIPQWNAFFYWPSWPMIVVGVLWNHDLSPSLVKAVSRFLGIVLGGSSMYTIILMFNIQPSNRSELEAY